MATGNFPFYNVTFKRKGDGKWVFAEGEIENNTNKDYSVALFRISVFDKNILIWTGPLKIKGFKKRQHKPFEILMEGLNYYSLSTISRYDIYFESGY